MIFAVALRMDHPVQAPGKLIDALVGVLARCDRQMSGYGYRYTAPCVRKRPMVRMHRLWQALINEARFRGYDVSVNTSRRPAD